MTQMQATTAEPSALEAGPPIMGRSIGGKSLPTQVISFAIGNDQYGVDIMAVREIKGGRKSRICRSSPNMSAAYSICAASSCRSSICAAGSVRD